MMCVTQKLSWPGSAQRALQPTSSWIHDQNMDPREESLTKQGKEIYSKPKEHLLNSKTAGRSWLLGGLPTI